MRNVRCTATRWAPLVAGCLLGSAALAEPPPAAPTYLEVANLAHYSAENAALQSPKSDERRIVFMGDSITEGWRDADPAYFETAGRLSRIDRGISGQTTAQMLLRFEQDVVALHPAAVHILAGTNDIAANWGAMPLETTERMIASMAELAHDNGIRVIIGSVPPARTFPWRPGLEPGPTVVQLNDWLRAYCGGKGFTYVDYYAALTDGNLGMRPELAADGVHPTPAGYRIMRTLTDAAIDRALKSRSR